jgi:hypothetical protein
MKTLAARPARRALTAVAGLALALSALAWFAFVGPAPADSGCHATFSVDCGTVGLGCYAIGNVVNAQACTPYPNLDTGCCYYQGRCIGCIHTDRQRYGQPCTDSCGNQVYGGSYSLVGSYNLLNCGCGGNCTM